MEKWPSGQWQQTVNLSAQAFAGSNPAFSTSLRSYELHPARLGEDR